MPRADLPRGAARIGSGLYRLNEAFWVPEPGASDDTRSMNGSGTYWRVKSVLSARITEDINEES